MNNVVDMFFLNMRVDQDQHLVKEGGIVVSHMGKLVIDMNIEFIFHNWLK